MALEHARDRLDRPGPDTEKSLRVERAASGRGVREREGGDRDRLAHLAGRDGRLGGPAVPNRVRGCRRVEGGLLPEDLALEALQLGARLDPELLDEDAARVLVGGERLRLPARAIESEHQLPPEALAKRVPGDEDLELADQIAGLPAREVEVDPRLEGHEAKLFEPGDLALRKRLVAEVDERGAAPQRERLAEQLRGCLRVPLGALLPRPAEQGLEAVAIELPGLDLKEIAGRARDEARASGAEGAPKPRDVALQRCPRGLRRILAPELVDQAVGGDDLVLMKEEDGENGALPRPAEGDRPFTVRRLERPQNSEVHFRPTEGTPTFSAELAGL